MQGSMMTGCHQYSTIQYNLVHMKVLPILSKKRPQVYQFTGLLEKLPEDNRLIS